MKLIKIFFGLLLMCGIYSSLASCDSIASHIDEISSASTTDMENIDSDSSLNESEQIHINEPSDCFEGMDAYNQYIEKTKLPEDFVSYAMLQSIGEFESLLFPTSGDTSYYIYYLIDENGFPLVIYIEHIDDGEISDGKISADSDTIILQKVLESGMAFNSEYKSKKVLINNIEYTYTSDGDLRYVSTVVGNNVIRVGADSVFDPSTKKFVRLKLSDYEIQNNNLVGYMLLGNPENIDLVSHLLAETSE